MYYPCSEFYIKRLLRVLLLFHKSLVTEGKIDSSTVKNKIPVIFPVSFIQLLTGSSRDLRLHISFKVAPCDYSSEIPV